MKSILSALGLFILVNVSAQSVSYVVLEDNPSNAYSKFIAPELGSEFNSTTLSVYLGANARYGLTEKITLEGIARYDVYQSSGSGPAFLFEGGAFLPLKSKTKQKEVPVILSYNAYAGETFKDGVRYNIEETKSINIPKGNYLNNLGVRGGVHVRSLGITDMLGTINSNIFHSGVYLGGQFTTQASVKTKINDDVIRYGAGFTRMYFDVLVLPVSNISDDNPALVSEAKSDGTFGWRAGFQWFVSPHDGDYKFLGNSVFTAEIGTRPLSGFMFNFSWGFAFMRDR